MAQVINRSRNDLTLIPTPFGYVAVGCVPHDGLVGNSLVSVTNPRKIDLTHFWDLEHLGILPSELVETKVSDDIIIQKFRDSRVRLPSGRYSVDLNVNDKVESLRSNRNICFKQFLSLQKKLDADPTLKKLYSSEIKLFLDRGFAEAFPSNQTPRFFLPHFPVINHDKESYKIRPVFNASSHSRSLLSLNDCISDTPNLLPTSIEILAKFRFHRVSLTADISKAYLMIDINPSFRNFLCFFWFKDSFSSEPSINRMTANTFGVKDSQFNAIMVIRDQISSSC